MKRRITLINMITSILLQFFTLLNGFIIPKLILTYFGSEVNGLVSSLNQFLSYISLLEGGVTGVITASLYKPLVEKDVNKIGSIIKTSQSFYRKIAILFFAYTIVLGIIYPFLFNNSFSFIYIFLLTIILSINLFIQYAFSLTYKTFLIADKKMYVVCITQIIIIILNIFLSIISLNIYPDIHILKLISCSLFVIQPIIYKFFINKNYNLNKENCINNDLLKNRWNGFAVNIAHFIHFSTDIVILTIFTDLKMVSIYSVYNLVINGLSSIIGAVSSSINPVIGQAYAKADYNELDKKFELHEIVIFILTFLLFSIAGLLITPFVLIYTKGITDVNYYQPIFGYLILISQGLYIIKFPHLNLAYSANKFKEITKPCFIEAGLNIIISVVLVNFLGLKGVAIGTLVAMIYRMIEQVKFTSKSLLKKKKQSDFYKKMALFSLFTIFGILICKMIIPVVKIDLLSWIGAGILYTLIMLMTYSFLLISCYRRDLDIMFKYFSESGVKDK